MKVQGLFSGFFPWLPIFQYMRQKKRKSRMTITKWTFIATTIVCLLSLPAPLLADSWYINLSLTSDDTCTNVSPGTSITVNFTADQDIKQISNIDFTASGSNSLSLSPG